MLFGLCLGYDTAIVGPQASQACWCMLDDAVRPANTCGGALCWMRGREVHAVHSCGSQSTRAGTSARAETGGCSGTKNAARALLASDLQVR